MTATHDIGDVRLGRLLNGLKRTRFVLATAALVFGGLWMLGAIGAEPAFIGFVLIAAAALIASAGVEVAPAIVPRMSCSSAWSMADARNWAAPGGVRRTTRFADASAEISSSWERRRMRSSFADPPSGARGVRKPPSLGTA